MLKVATLTLKLKLFYARHFYWEKDSKGTTEMYKFHQLVLRAEFGDNIVRVRDETWRGCSGRSRSTTATTR
jgi:hypothetical protein